MKKNTIIFILLVIQIFLGVKISYSQERKLKKADEKYDQLSYIDAMEIYLKVAESGYKSEELFKKLGNSCYFNADYECSAKWYRELFGLNGSISDSKYYLRYSQSLKAIGKDLESEEWFDIYTQNNGLSNDNTKNAKDYLAIIDNNSGRYKLEPLSINTDGVDFGGSILGDNLVYASTKHAGSLIKKRSAWDGMPFLDLYEAPIDKEGILGKPKKLKGDINTRFHESSGVFTKDGKTMYFTRSNVTPDRKFKSKDDIQRLKIYRAHLVNGKWINIEDLSINNDSYSTAHPALSPDEKILYFVSDMPGSMGGTDLFKVVINPDGSLGRVSNLGESINTVGRESFPYVTKDNELYFSSDGHFGLGGYDVFYTPISKDLNNANLLNVGAPINSQYDDIAFMIDEGKGYITSNRTGGKGQDDIYHFIELKDIKELLKSKIYGRITDELTNKPLSGAFVEILDENNKKVTELQTDDTGYYEAEVDYDSSYIIKVNKQKYNSEDAYSIKKVREREHKFKLKRIIEKVKTGDDIAKILNIKIHFDFDKSNIRSDARVELEKLLIALKENPNLKIEIRSHTDSKGNASYNMFLSERRAKSTLNYLVQNGIDKSRLTAKGYGETQLINNCTNGIPCSDEKHAANRRSEFVIKR